MRVTDGEGEMATRALASVAVCRVYVIAFPFVLRSVPTCDERRCDELAASLDVQLSVLSHVS